LCDCTAWKFDAKFPINVLREPGAIECAGTFGAPDIGTADQARGEIDGVGGKGERGKRQRPHEHCVPDWSNHGSPSVDAAVCAGFANRNGAKRRPFRAPQITR